MHRPHVLMSVTRHEGRMPHKIVWFYRELYDCHHQTRGRSSYDLQEMVKRTYPPHAQPWEKENNLSR